MKNNDDATMLAPARPMGGGMLTAFRDLEQMFRVSDYLAKSPIVPKAFAGQPGSVMIALNMAQRLRMDPFMVMQNIVVVNGNAGMSGKFAIALLNRSPKYARIEYRYCNGRDFMGGMQVIGHRADDPEDRTPDVGTAVTPQMVEAEGWGRNPKWRSMPEQMYRYRAASFFARAFVPEELMGMQTAEELEDVAHAGGIRDVTRRTQPRAAVVTPSFLEGDKAAAGNDAANASVTEGTASRFQDAPVAELTAAMSTRLAENPAKPDEIPGLEGAGDVPPFGEVVKG